MCGDEPAPNAQRWLRNPYCDRIDGRSVDWCHRHGIGATQPDTGQFDLEVLAVGAPTLKQLRVGHPPIIDHPRVPYVPQMDDYEPRSEISLLGARSKGDGATYAILQFHGAISTFREECSDEMPESIFA